jgi:hypothetical protein
MLNISKRKLLNKIRGKMQAVIFAIKTKCRINLLFIFKLMIFGSICEKRIARIGFIGLFSGLDDVRHG